MSEVGKTLVVVLPSIKGDELPVCIQFRPGLVFGELLTDPIIEYGILVDLHVFVNIQGSQK